MRDPCNEKIRDMETKRMSKSKIIKKYVQVKQENLSAFYCGQNKHIAFTSFLGWKLLRSTKLKYSDMIMNMKLLTTR